MVNPLTGVGAISMGTLLVQTGALHTMTAIMFDWLRPLVTSSTFALPVVPYWTAFIYHIFLGNEISMLATSMPGLMSFAHANGIHPLPLGLIWAFAAGGTSTPLDNKSSLSRS